MKAKPPMTRNLTSQRAKAANRSVQSEGSSILALVVGVAEDDAIPGGFQALFGSMALPEFGVKLAACVFEGAHAEHGDSWIGPRVHSFEFNRDFAGQSRPRGLVRFWRWREVWSGPFSYAFQAIRKTRYVPVSEKIATGQITVKAGSYVQYKLKISEEMITSVLSGSFNASGGGGNDIHAYLADEMNLTNLINGHQGQVLWGTGGKLTTGKFEVPLQPGEYYLVFSNRFSTFSDKLVFLEAALNHKREEVYYE